MEQALNGDRILNAQLCKAIFTPPRLADGSAWPYGFDGTSAPTTAAGHSCMAAPGKASKALLTVVSTRLATLIYRNSPLARQAPRAQIFGWHVCCLPQGLKSVLVERLLVTRPVQIRMGNDCFWLGCVKRVIVVFSGVGLPFLAS